MSRSPRISETSSGSRSTSRAHCRRCPPGGRTSSTVSFSTDIRVTKHQWGAFHGTDLDDQLRRRGITTIVLGGVSTNFGVESTARQGWERGYAIVIAEDATASSTPEMHAFSIEKILPRISRVAKAADIDVRHR